MLLEYTRWPRDREMNILMWNLGLIFIIVILHYGAAASTSRTSCRPPYVCVSAASCTARHRDAGSNALNNSLVFRCGADASMDCCPPVNLQRIDSLRRKLLPEDCSPAFDSKISNGVDADLGEFPWMALIGRKSKVWPFNVSYFCGGSVISKRYILTAAHCVIPISQITTVRLAEYSLNTTYDVVEVFLDEFKNLTTTDIRVGRVTSHPAWNSKTLENDIALIRVKKDIDFSTEYIKPICLPFNLANMVMEGENFTVAGWGMTGASSFGLSNVLQKAAVEAYSTSDCTYLARKQRSPAGDVNDTLQVCVVQSPNKPGATCKGDSGGPLMAIVNNMYMAVGIVSFGLGRCDDQSSATVFTRIYPYLDWILETMTIE